MQISNSCIILETFQVQSGQKIKKNKCLGIQENIFILGSERYNKD